MNEENKIIDLSQNYKYAWDFRGTICERKCIDVKVDALSQTTYFYFESDVQSEPPIIIAIQGDWFWNKPYQKFVDDFEKHLSCNLIPKIKYRKQLREKINNDV